MLLSHGTRTAVTNCISVSALFPQSPVSFDNICLAVGLQMSHRNSVLTFLSILCIIAHLDCVDHICDNPGVPVHILCSDSVVCIPLIHLGFCYYEQRLWDIFTQSAPQLLQTLFVLTSCWVLFFFLFFCIFWQLVFWSQPPMHSVNSRSNRETWHAMTPMQSEMCPK